MIPSSSSSSRKFRLKCRYTEEQLIDLRTGKYRRENRAKPAPLLLVRPGENGGTITMTVAELLQALGLSLSSELS